MQTLILSTYIYFCWYHFWNVQNQGGILGKFKVVLQSDKKIATHYHKFKFCVFYKCKMVHHLEMKLYIWFLIHYRLSFLPEIPPWFCTLHPRKYPYIHTNKHVNNQYMGKFVGEVQTLILRDFYFFRVSLSWNVQKWGTIPEMCKWWGSSGQKPGMVL